MKTKSMAYVLWVLGAFGIGGLHRFYVGRSGSGWLYLLTFNLCFIGMVIDYKAIPAMIDEANRLVRGGPLVQQNNTQTNQQNVVVNVTVPAVAAGPSVREVIKIRCAHCGTLAEEKAGGCGECGAKI